MLEAAANAAANGGTAGRRDVSRSVDRPQAGLAARAGGVGGGQGSQQQQQQQRKASSSADRSSMPKQTIGSAIAPPTSHPNQDSLLGNPSDFSSWNMVRRLPVPGAGA
jgi:hypothetical protein